MVIYVFKRPDGTEWADYRVPEGAVLIKSISANSAGEIDDVIESETGRVRALAERAKSECAVDEPLAKVNDRGFFGRLKWLLSGK